MSTNCNILEGGPDANDREEHSSRTREENSSLSFASEAPSQELHLEGEGKEETKDDDGIEGDLEVIHRNDSMGTFEDFHDLLDDNTNNQSWRRSVFNRDGDPLSIPYLPPLGNTQDMDDPGNEQGQCEGIESTEAGMAGELSFDGGGKSGVSSAGDFSASQDKGSNRKRRASSSCGSDVSSKRRNSAMTKQEKDETREKNEKSVKAAHKRELKRFKAWFPNQQRTEPVEWSSINAEPDRIEGDEGRRFIKNARRSIARVKQLGMTNATETRLNYVLDNCYGSTYAALFDSSLMCHLKIKDGKRKESYDQKYCKVCETIGKKIVQVNHDCPYCHKCFYKSWKRPKVLMEDCNDQHDGSSEEEASAVAETNDTQVTGV